MLRRILIKITLKLVPMVYVHERFLFSERIKLNITIGGHAKSSRHAGFERSIAKPDTRLLGDSVGGMSHGCDEVLGSVRDIISLVNPFPLIHF